MTRLRLPLCSLPALVALTACPVPAVDGDDTREEEGEEGEGEAGEGESEVSCLPDDDTGFPAPRADRTDRIGSASTFDIGAWNIRNFPRALTTVATVADVITSLDLDLVALEEIEDEAAFNELVARLPTHEGVLSTDTYSDGTYQKLAVLYRCGLLTPGTPSLLFTSDGFTFPRPPLQVPFHYDDGDRSFDFTVIVVHFKAGEDAESVGRRNEAFFDLQTYVDSLVASSAADEVVILGDFNERFDEEPGATNWAPFFDTTKYVVRTQPLSDRGESSFLSGSGAILDHIVTTRALDDEVGAGTAAIPRVEFDIEDYRDDVSDHRPVTLVFRGL